MDRLDRQGFGEGHASSDEEDAADDADATDARKRQRQQVETANLNSEFLFCKILFYFATHFEENIY